MPQLIDGRWVSDAVAAGETRDGAFHREQAKLRTWISADGQPDAKGRPTLKAEAGRYHLYLAYICPWACRTLMMRSLKGLDGLIGVTIANPAMDEGGWSFLDADGNTRDTLNGVTHLYELYLKSDPRYTGKCSVPVLWDKQTGRIVNNESSEIIRMLNTAFDGLTGNRLDFYPAPLAGLIDEWNERIYESINNGVYKAGFAQTQAAYEKAFDVLFATLDLVEARLAATRYLAGAHLTEADIRLFVTLIRFDVAYHGQFKCNLRRIEDYPNLSNYVRELYQWPGIRDTVRIDHIKAGYYSLPDLNPRGIVPKGPAVDFDRAHNRDRLEGKGVWLR